LIVVLLVALTLLAAALRLAGLGGPDGQLNIDEARLALAAKGVTETGLPMLPSGRIYTRGLLEAYLIGGSFALFGRSDLTAWLPSVAAGVLLVPVTFLLGRAMGGGAAGLAAAAFVALASPLIDWSRVAWLPSPFLLLLTTTIFCWYRGFVQRQGRWQVIGAAAFVLALLAYEFAVLALAGLGLYLGLRLVRGRRNWYRGWPTLLALGIVLAGLGLFATLTLMLRTGTLAGPLGEAEWWFSPNLASFGGAQFYTQTLLADYVPLIVAALAGFLPLLRLHPRGATYLGCMTLIAFGVPSFIIQVKFSERYALPVLPLLAVLAASGMVALARLAARHEPHARLRAALPWLALLVVFGPALWGDASATPRRLGRVPPDETWVQAVHKQGLRPDDLIVTDQPSKLHYYLGRADYYVRQRDYERYVYRAPDGAIRQIYTEAELVQKPGDFERTVESANPGRAVWLLGRKPTLLAQLAAIDPDLWPRLTQKPAKLFETRDGWVLLRYTPGGENRAPSGSS
jgi:4-amino-4-deoxy-L-arabinose transferase-like glycosyltransferase